MAVKTNRIWAQRSEAISILAALPSNATATDLASALFNSSNATITSDVVKQRTVLAAQIRAKREAEDKVLAAVAATEAPATTQATGTTGKSK